MKGIIFIVFLFASFSLCAKVECTGKDKDKAWINERYKNDQTANIFRFGLSQFGELIKCSGQRTYLEEGDDFGDMTYVFKNSAKLTIRSAAPEVTDYSLVSEQGFANEAEAIKKLKDFIASTGLKIDWSKPESYKDKGREQRIFRNAKDEDTNCFAILGYKSKKLVEIGYGMTL